MLARPVADSGVGYRDGRGCLACLGLAFLSFMLRVFLFSCNGSYICLNTDMRLLHTAELRFEEFFADKTPPYAILSHRWIDELTHQEFLYLNKDGWAGGHVFIPFVVVDERKRESSGYHKIMAFRSIAYKDGYDWCWIDTVCIDKTSSAELSEAINSMFQWYEQSSICYTYLADVPDASEEGVHDYRCLRESAWFRRGWTLQELIAPTNVIMLDAKWDNIGDRTSLQRQLTGITGIPRSVLETPHSIYALPVAERMALAADRETTRVEDRAYSLLGLFKVNIPLLYGEGDRAFRRLQQSIIQQHNDESVFVHSGWRIFASRPDDFRMHKRSTHETAVVANNNRKLTSDTVYEPGHTGREMLEAIIRTPLFDGVQMMTAYFDIPHGNGRIILLDYPSPDDANLPTFVYVSRSGPQSRIWRKLGIAAERADQAGEGRFYWTDLKKFREDFRKSLKSSRSILKRETMYIV